MLPEGVCTKTLIYLNLTFWRNLAGDNVHNGQTDVDNCQFIQR